MVRKLKFSLHTTKERFTWGNINDHKLGIELRNIPLFPFRLLS